MPFRHVAFFIKCRARGGGICSWGGGRPQLFRAILSIASSKTGARGPEVDKNGTKSPNFVYRCLQKGRATSEVDKNGTKSPNFVYRILQKGRARLPK